MGPNLNLEIRRSQLASADLAKEARRIPKEYVALTRLRVWFLFLLREFNGPHWASKQSLHFCLCRLISLPMDQSVVYLSAFVV